MEKFKKVWDITTTIVVTAVVILAILLVGVRVAGIQVFTVLSGSMEPVYHTGALIYVKEVDYKEVEPGQVITFMLDEDTIATHRVVEIVEDENDSSILRFRTKGDANDSVDGQLVHYKNILGSPIFSIPYLGYLASYIQNPPGLYIAIAISALVLLLVFLPDLIFSSEENAKTEKQNLECHKEEVENDKTES